MGTKSNFGCLTEYGRRSLESTKESQQMKRGFLIVAALIGLVALSGTPARADGISVSFGYSTSYYTPYCPSVYYPPRTVYVYERPVYRPHYLRCGCIDYCTCVHARRSRTRVIIHQYDYECGETRVIHHRRNHSDYHGPRRHW